MHKDLLLVSAAMLGLAAAAAGAYAQNADPQESTEPQRRAASQPADPPGPTTLDASQLEQRGITSLQGIAAASPGITLVPSVSSLNTPLLYMRGQGLESPEEITLDGAVAVYEDGIYVARPVASTFDLLDLDHVEVLSGPQGALYGRDTTGGVVNLVSAAPAGELRFRQTLDAGNRDLFRGGLKFFSTLDGRMQEFLPGVGHLANETRSPVIPVHVRGTHRVMPKGRRFFLPAPVDVRIGRPLEPGRGEGSRAFTRRVEDAVRELGRGSAEPRVVGGWIERWNASARPKSARSR